MTTYPVKEKDPAATLDYVVDWSPALTAGETILSATWSAPAALTVVADAFTDTAASIWLSSGIDRRVYMVSCTVTTSVQRTDRRRFYLRSRAR